MKLSRTNLSLSFLIIGFLLCNTAQSALISADFSWLGDAGYKAKGRFTYDNAFAVISTIGSNRTGGNNFNQGLYSLELEFYDPSHNLLSSVVDVAAGDVLYSSLNFNFNTSTMAFEGLFDMGQDSGVIGGEYYIWGTIGGTDSYFEEVNGSTLDSQTTPTINVSQSTVPEPGTLSMLLSGLCGLLVSGKRIRSRSSSRVCGIRA